MSCHCSHSAARSSGLLPSLCKGALILVIQALIAFDVLHDFLARVFKFGPEIPVSVDQPLDRFEDDIRAFETHDLIKEPPSGGTVFIGSSTFAHAAARIESEFADLHAVSRAFGGSTIPEINHYLTRVVLKYKPVRICFYAGTNDIADGHRGRRVYRDFLKFVESVQIALPQTEVFFVSMSAAPCRQQWVRQYSVGNRLIRLLARRVDNLHYVDVLPTMYDAHGNFHNDWFLEDQLHMNNHGYDAWFPVIRQVMTRC